MGMFDYVRCHYSLPADGLDHRTWQTKGMSCELNTYEIRADGTLWLHSSPRWRTDPKPHQYTGEVRFYGFQDEQNAKGWVTFSAYFVKGALHELHLVEPMERVED